MPFLSDSSETLLFLFGSIFSQVDVESLGYTTSKLSLASRKSNMVRPMSRKDIFYSGSVTNLPEYHQSQKSLTNYRQSIMSLPKMKQLDDESSRK